MRFFFKKPLDIEKVKKDLSVLKTFTEVSDYLSKNLQVADNEEIAKIVLDKNPDNLLYLSKRLKDNEEIVRYASDRHPSSVYYASTRLRNNRELAEKAIKGSSTFFGNLPEDSPLRMDREFVELYLKDRRYGSILDIPIKFFDQNLDITAKVLEEDGMLIRDMSSKIKDNFGMVRRALNNSALSFEYASNRLKDDDAMVDAVLDHQPYAFRFVSDRHQLNREKLLKAVSKCGELLNSLQKPESFFDKMTNGIKPAYPDYSYRDDEEVVTAAIKNDGNVFKSASDRLKQRKDLAKIAVEQTEKAVLGLNFSLRADNEIMSIVAKKNLYDLNATILSTFNKNEIPKIIDGFSSSLKNEPQSYFVEAIQNAKRVRQLDTVSKECFDNLMQGFLQYATYDTLVKMDGYTKNDEELNKYIQKAMPRAKLLELGKISTDGLYQDRTKIENEEYKKSRKVLLS